MNLPAGCNDEMELLQDWLPLENHEAVLPPGSRGLYVVSRHRARGAWTWIGLYRPFPAHLTGRPHAFFGIGIWLRDVALSGEQVCATLEEAAARAEALMMRARVWNTAQFDFADVGCDDASARSLLARFHTIEGGLDFGGGAKVGIKTDGREGTGGVAAALDYAQNGRDLQAYSRALIPADEEASFHVRSVRDWVSVANETWFTARLRHLAARTTALPAPPRTAVPEKAATNATKTEAAMQRRLELVEEQVRELEHQVASADRPPYLANAMSAFALLSACCVAAYVLAPLLSSSPAASRRPDTPESARASTEASLPPSSQSVAEGLLARPAIPAPASDTRDPSVRTESSVRALWALVEGSTALSPGDRRALNRSLGDFIEALRLSTDPKLKSAGELLGNAQAEQSRSKLRTSN